MKSLIAGALLVSLSGVTSIARAESAPAPRATVAGEPSRPARPPTPPAPTSEANDYAAREAAAPALGEFEGGHRGIYISGAALVLIVLLVIILI